MKGEIGETGERLLGTPNGRPDSMPRVGGAEAGGWCAAMVLSERAWPGVE